MDEALLQELKKKYPHRYELPQIHPSVFLAPGAHVHGDVHIGRDSSVWFNTVLRGDVNYIRVGERTNIQDNCTVHVAYRSYPTLIGNGVTIGHNAIVHACRIGDFSLIGMGAKILDGAEIGDFVLIGAGSLVTSGTRIPSGHKAFGSPARVVGPLTEQEKERLRFSAEHYVSLARTYASLSARNSS